MLLLVALSTPVTDGVEMFRTLCTVLVILLLSALPAIGQTSQPATDQTKSSKVGSITGRVVDESGQPLANAQISIQPVEGIRRTGPTSTDREGTFKVTGLDPVPYRVHASMPAYINASDEQESDPPKQYKIGDSVTFVLTKGGVITGRVNTATGDPIIGIKVHARMIRDRNGGQMTSSTMVRESATDDRGIYRIYGLPTGTYTVVAGGSHDYASTGFGAFDTYLPTYAPSSTRDTATEISVRAGEEISNVDIRFRGERGRTISGTASGLGINGGFSVNLTTVAPADSQSNISNFNQPGNSQFAFHGIADGDYYLTAQSNPQSGEQALSEPKLIEVRGADIEGIDLTIRALGSVSGRVVLEESKRSECQGKQPPTFKEMFISAWHKESEAARNQPEFIWSMGEEVNPDSQGNFTLRNLAPSQYYFDAQFTGGSWYLKSISITPSATTGAGSGQARTAVDVTRVWTNVRTGDRLSGLVFTLAQGAASFQGQVVLTEGETPPEGVLLYLVPAEREAADELLRFYGGETEKGKFELHGLAPGRYWILVQPANDTALSRFTKMLLPDETETRAQLRRDAEAAKTEIELKPCQRMVDFRLPFKPPSM